MLEMPVALLCRRFGWSRPAAALGGAAACWTVGLGSVLSFNKWASWFPLAFVPGLEHATLFDVFDRLTSQLMLPVGGLLLSVFAGWVLAPQVLKTELGLGRRADAALLLLLRYITPAGVAATMLFAIFG